MTTLTRAGVTARWVPGPTDDWQFVPELVDELLGERQWVPPVSERWSHGLPPLPEDQRFRNALTTAHDTGLPYVEGIALSANPEAPDQRAWLWHAWNLDDDGRVLDRTAGQLGEIYIGVVIDDWRTIGPAVPMLARLALLRGKLKKRPKTRESTKEYIRNWDTRYELFLKRPDHLLQSPGAASTARAYGDITTETGPIVLLTREDDVLAVYDDLDALIDDGWRVD